MSPRQTVRAVKFRLVAETPPGSFAASRPRRLYRPLVIGPVLVCRPDPRGRWVARVSGDGLLAPVAAPGSGDLGRWLDRLGARGIRHRIAAALVTPQDLSGRPLVILSDEPGRGRPEFYGWSLLYQPPGAWTVAYVDSHERFAELPAFYQSPLELIDRTRFMAARGIPSRPLALVTQPTDFAPEPDGRLLNMFYPAERFRSHGGPDWLC